VRDDQDERKALADPTLQVNMEDRFRQFLDHHQAQYSLVINTLFGWTSNFGPAPDLVRTHLVVLEFAYNPTSRDNFELLLLEKCYLQSREDFLLTPAGEMNREEVNGAFDRRPKNCIGNPALVAPLVNTRHKGGGPISILILPIKSSFGEQHATVRNYVSHKVLKSLQLAFKGPACLSDLEACYRSSLREARWGIQPHGESFHLP
jgi:hypothetical protein